MSCFAFGIIFQNINTFHLSSPHTHLIFDAILWAHCCLSMPWIMSTIINIQTRFHNRITRSRTKYLTHLKHSIFDFRNIHRSQPCSPNFAHFSPLKTRKHSSISYFICSFVLSRPRHHRHHHHQREVLVAGDSNEWSPLCHPSDTALINTEKKDECY